MLAAPGCGTGPAGSAAPCRPPAGAGTACPAPRRRECLWVRARPAAPRAPAAAAPPSARGARQLAPRLQDWRRAGRGRAREHPLPLLIPLRYLLGLFPRPSPLGALPGGQLPAGGLGLGHCCRRPALAGYAGHQKSGKTVLKKLLGRCSRVSVATHSLFLHTATGTPRQAGHLALSFSSAAASAARLARLPRCFLFVRSRRSL